MVGAPACAKDGVDKNTVPTASNSEQITRMRITFPFADYPSVVGNRRVQLSTQGHEKGQSLMEGPGLRGNRLESVGRRCNLEDRLMLADFHLRSFRLILRAKRL